MLKLEHDMLSDTQVELLKAMLKQYQTEKNPTAFTKQRIQEIKEVLSEKEQPIESRAYHPYVE
jgi:hypothetical protein